jgi:WXG100 family type VII secretion target
MAEGMVKVEFGGLDTLHSQLQQRVNDLETLLSQITNHVDTVNGVWNGAGNTSFNGAHAKWHATQQNVKDVLHEIRTTVGTSNTNYQDTEHAVAQSFSGFGG